MNLLLDTQTLLWWLDGDARLSRPIRDGIASGSDPVYVSAGTTWEVATKSRLGKLPQVRSASRLPEVVQEQGFTTLAITVADAHRAGWLAGLHRDPFDKLLVAQALERGLTIATRDTELKALGAQTLW